jgi:hypothetical protein
MRPPPADSPAAAGASASGGGNLGKTPSKRPPPGATAQADPSVPTPSDAAPAPTREGPPLSPVGAVTASLVEMGFSPPVQDDVAARLRQYAGDIGQVITFFAQRPSTSRFGRLAGRCQRRR